MKFLLIFSLCTVGALADVEDLPGSNEDRQPRQPVFQTLIPDLDLARDVLWYMRERAKLLRQRAGVQNPDVSDIYIPEPREITAEDLRDDYLEEENEDESTDRTKRTLKCQEDLQGESIYPRTSVIQTQISRLEGIRDLLNYKKGMFRKKLMYNKKSGMPLGAWIMSSDQIGVSRAKQH